MFKGYRRALVALFALALVAVAIPASTDVEAQPAPVEITELCRSIYTGHLRYAHPSNGCNPTSEVAFEMLENFPYTLCASYYTGQVRVPGSGGCTAGELTLTIPDDLPVYFCINLYTGQVRYTYSPTTCATGSFLAGISQPPPIAEDDAYDSLGNVGVDVANAVDGLFANDTLEGATLDSFQNPSANGGTVQVNADGSFDYTPPPGFEGDDTFTYTISNGGGSSTATVTITVTEVIWFIDDDAAGPGDGTIVDPFSSLANFDTIAADETGDTIFVYEGQYPESFTGLLDDQQLIGQAVDLLTVTGFVPPAFSRPLPGATAGPEIAPLSGNVVPLADNNLITGVTLLLAVDGISAPSGATGTIIDQVTISNMAGAGIRITPSTDTTITNVTFETNVTDILLNADNTTIQDVTSLFSDTSISISNITNSLLIERVDIDGATTAGVVLDTAQAGSTTTLNDVAVDDATGVSGVGLQITSSAAGSSFDINSLDIGADAPLDGDSIQLMGNGGTLDVDAASSVTHAAASTALAVSAADGAMLTFAGSIDATSGDGLQFNDADGTYTFTGTTTLNGGDAGIDILGNSNGTFTFGANTSVTNPTGDAFHVTGDTTNSPAITYSGTLTNNAGDIIEITDTAGANTVAFDSATADAISDSGPGTGIFLNGVGQDVTVAADTELTGAEGVDIDAGSGTFTFVNTHITDTENAAAVDVNGGTTTVNFPFASTINQTVNQSAYRVSNGHAGGNSTFTGTITATNGDGLQFDNADGATYSFNGVVTLNGGDAGIDIVNGSSGAFTFGFNTSITNPTGDAFHLTGDGVATPLVTYTGTITNDANDAIEISNSSGGTFNFNNPDPDAIQDSGAGTGIFLSDVGHTINFNADINLSGAEGVDIDGGTGTFNFSNTTITDTELAPALDINGGSTSVVFQVAGLINQSENQGAVHISGGHSGGPVTISRPINATNGDGIQIDNAQGGPYSFNNTVILNGGDAAVDIVNGSSGAYTFSNLTVTNPASGPGVNITGGTTLSTFTQLDIDTTNTTGFNVDGANVVNVSSGTVDTSGAPALDFTDVNLGATFTGVSSATSSGVGVNLDQVSGTLGITTLTVTNPTSEGLFVNGSSGTFTVSSGSISGADNTAAVRVDASGAADTSTLTYDGSLTNTSNRSVRIENKTGGAVNLGGTLNDSGAGVLVQNNSGGTAVDFDSASKTLSSGPNQAVTLANNTGATISFSNGGLDIDTSGAATGFNATGGGTVNVTGSGNSINTSTGTGVALNIDSTDIGASNVVFRSIDVDGAANGIVLNATGTSGGLTVTGDGTSTLGGNGSGGTLQNTTGIAVDVDNAVDLNLMNVTIGNPTGDGIDVDQLSGTSRIESVTITNIDQSGTSAIRLLNNARADMNLTIDSSSFTNSATGQSLVLVQFQGAIGTTTVQVEDSLWQSNDPASFQLDGYLGSGVETSGTLVHNFLRNTVEDVSVTGTGDTNHSCGGALTCTYDISDNVYRNLAKIGNFNAGYLNAGYGGGQIDPGSTMTLMISGNQLSGTDAASQGHRRGINIINEGSGSNVADMNLTIDNNVVDDMGDREALYISNRAGGGHVLNFDVWITRNRFGTGEISGTTAGNIGGTRDGVFIENAVGTMNLLFGGSLADANTVQSDNSLSDAIVEIEADDLGSTVNATVTHNVFSSSGDAPVELELTSDGLGFCLDLRENSASNVGGIPWRLVEDGSDFVVEGAGLGAVSQAQLQGPPHNNTGDFTFLGTITNNNNTNCTMPA